MKNINKSQNLITAMYNYYFRDGMDKNPQQYRRHVPANIADADGSIADPAVQFTDFGYSLAG